MCDDKWGGDPLATIRDVAQLAEVSVATVSRVMNNSGYVNSETRERVLRAIKELDYHPNVLARGLNKKRTKTLGLLLPDITNPFFPQLARAVEDVAQEFGYSLVLCNSDDQPEKELHYIKILEQKYIDGVLVVSSSFSREDLHERIPVVVFDRIGAEDIPAVCVKNRSGARLAVNHLFEIGCKRIGHLRGPFDASTADERYRGYIDAVQTQPWFSDNYVEVANFDMELAKTAVLRLLQRQPDIDGIFAGNDLMAVGALKALLHAGYRVPEDIALIGFDGIPLTETVVPEISTIVQPIYEMGELATRLLLQLIEQKPVLEQIYELDVQLLQRTSTRKK